MNRPGSAPRRRSRRLHRGMTLVEVIVAFAILALVVTVLGASVRSVGQSATRIDAQMDQSDEMRVTAAFLREVLGRATFQRNPKTGQPLYQAGANEFVWIGNMPLRLGGPTGRHFFRLALETVPDAEAALVLRFAPWTEAGVPPDWPRAESRVLVPGVSQLELAYGGAGLEQGWAAAWTDKERLPPRVRVALATTTQTWPPLVLPMRALEPVQRASFGAEAP